MLKVHPQYLSALDILQLMKASIPQWLSQEQMQIISFPNRDHDCHMI